ncbi:MAG: hypothetical protein BWY22_00343 [Bacteroidetes bacterium ADurb.Bin217]|nr:MAG: hypothetical protein BWY22_00343 [Bacteroidetes bacterium ADurb.Bin217]
MGLVFGGYIDWFVKKIFKYGILQNTIIREI